MRSWCRSSSEPPVFGAVREVTANHLEVLPCDSKARHCGAVSFSLTSAHPLIKTSIFFTRQFPFAFFVRLTLRSLSLTDRFDTKGSPCRTHLLRVFVLPCAPWRWPFRRSAEPCLHRPCRRNGHRQNGSQGRWRAATGRDHHFRPGPGAGHRRHRLLHHRRDHHRHQAAADDRKPHRRSP